MASTLTTLRLAAADPGMRRLQAASASWSAGEAAFLVGLFVVAYDLAGPAAVSAVAVIRTLPSIVLAPAMAAAAAGRSVGTSLRWTLAVRVASVGLLALVLVADVSIVLALALVAIDSVAATFLRPLRGAALPAVARSPEALIAGNVALTTGDALAALVGPTLAAAVLVAGGPLATFVPGLVLLVLALLAALGLRADAATAAPDARPVRPRERPASGSAGRGWLAGIRWLARSPARTIVGLFAAQRFTRGAITVLLVAAAIDLLGMGDQGVGLLTAALGLGGLVGGAVAVALVGRERLAPAFVAGIVMWGLGIAAVGIVPVAGVALLTLAVSGVGKVFLDVSGFSLLQRTTPNAMRTQVLGVQEGLVAAALAIGSVLAAVLIDLVGIGPALVLAGAFPIIATLLAWPALRRVDEAVVVPAREMRLLRGVAMFEPLPLTTIEELAAGLEWRTAADGEAIVHAGEPGDHFYIVDAGGASVAVDGQPERRLGPGDAFGEIALLRDVPRTATVRALGELRLASIDRGRFLAAVTRDPSSAATADRVVAAHLDRVGESGPRAG